MRSSWLAVLALLSVAACSSAAADGAASSSADDSTGAPALSAIKGREWARCWFDVVGQNAQLSCKSTARGSDPLAATVEAFGTTTGGSMQFQTFQQALDIEQGGTAVVATLPLDGFPVVMSVTAKLAGATQREIGLTNGVDFEVNLTVNSPADLSSSKPAIMAQPFDVWPVVTNDAMKGFSGGFGVQATPYTHDLGSYTSFLNETSMALSPNVTPDGKIHYFIAPANGAAIAVDEQLNGSHVATSIPGPGTYDLTPAGLEVSTTPSTVTPTPVPAPAPGPTPDPTPAPVVDTDPTCGGPGQHTCQNVDKKCDDGARYSQSSGTCVACGAAGQTYCYQDPNNYDSSSGGKCNAGTRYSQSSGTCVACGGAGQTYCYQDPNNYDASNGGHCNDGTRYSQSSNSCITCGAAGQTACYQDPNNYDSSTGSKCNDGLTAGFDGTCR